MNLQNYEFQVPMTTMLPCCANSSITPPCSPRSSGASPRLSFSIDNILSGGQQRLRHPEFCQQMSTVSEERRHRRLVQMRQEQALRNRQQHHWWHGTPHQLPPQDSGAVRDHQRALCHWAPHLAALPGGFFVTPEIFGKLLYLFTLFSVIGARRGGGPAAAALMEKRLQLPLPLASLEQ